MASLLLRLSFPPRAAACPLFLCSFLVLGLLPGCALLPVTKAAALPAPDQAAPGPGERVMRNKDGKIVLREAYLVDERGKVWRHGLEHSYWTDGGLRAIREFDHDEPIGAWKSYWPTGELRSEYLADPLRATQMVYFHPSGARASEGLAARGRREGPWTYWYANGVVGAVGNYVQGERQGPWHEYYSDGSPKSAGSYSAGDKIAPWTYWDAPLNLSSSSSSSSSRP